MKCQLERCGRAAAICAECYLALLRRYESLLEEKNNVVKECCELQAENSMLRIHSLQQNQDR